MTSIKKVLILYIFILAFPTWGGQFVLEAKKDVLIFMMADNDLVQQAHDDLEEIENVLPTMKHTNVFIDVHLPGHSFRQINHEKTKIAPTKSPIQKLEKFLQWYSSLKTANEKILILWGHGQGPLRESSTNTFGGVFTNTNNYPASATTNLGQILRQHPSTILIFDMCLMQNLSVFHHLKGATTTIMGSAQIQNFIGLPYDKVLSAIDVVENNSELSRFIVRETADIMPNTNYTFSAFYLAHTADIKEKLDLLNLRVKLELKEDPFKAFVISNYVIDLPTFPGGAIDLGMYLAILKLADNENILFSKRVHKRIRDVQEAINYALIENRFGKDYYDSRLNYYVEHFKGVSISREDTVFSYE